jgi:transcriptional regulator with XRE-family HTH domain
MDKRFNELPMSEQLQLRRRAIEEALSHPEWSLPEAIRHLKKTMRLTTAELARMAGVGARTLQDIEQEASTGTVQTMNKVLGVLGLKLGLVRARPGGAAKGDASAPDA